MPAFVHTFELIPSEQPQGAYDAQVKQFAEWLRTHNIKIAFSPSIKRAAFESEQEYSDELFSDEASVGTLAFLYPDGTLYEIGDTEITHAGIGVLHCVKVNSKPTYFTFSFGPNSSDVFEVVVGPVDLDPVCVSIDAEFKKGVIVDSVQMDDLVERLRNPEQQ